MEKKGTRYRKRIKERMQRGYEDAEMQGLKGYEDAEYAEPEKRKPKKRFTRYKRRTRK